MNQKLELKYIPINKLSPFEGNPRKISDRGLEILDKSVKHYGITNPILAWQNPKKPGKYEILAGHQRLKVFQKQGIKEIPVIVLDIKDWHDAYSYLLMDNKSQDYSEWDFPMLKDLTVELDDGLIEDIEITGFEEGELEDIFGYEGEEVEAPEPEIDRAEELQKKWETELGQIWKIGKHRLMCGDATKKEDVESLMDGEDNYAMLTDPPYNIGFSYKSIDDKKSEEDYKIFCTSWFNMFKPKSLIFTPGPKNERYYPEPKDKGIWIKKNATAGANCFYLRLAEPLLFYGEFKEKRNTDIFDYSTGFPNELKKARQENGIINDYAPVKPMLLWVELIKMLSNKIIVDCFLGNGTTLIACEQLNRICYGMEIDPAYIAVILQRVSDMGLEPKLIEPHT